MLQKLLSSRLIRFGAVGCIVTVFFMGLNALLSRVMGISPGLAFLVAYPPALFLHFTLNKLWTFGDGRATSSRHLAEYLYSVVVTFLIQWPAFMVLQRAFHVPGWLAAGGANVLQMAASFGMLKWRVFRHNAAADDERASDSWLRLAVLIVFLAGSAFIAWTALGKWALPDFNIKADDYYNLLVSGFRKGTLAMDVTVPDVMKNAANPWNPATRPNVGYLHDASFYGGRYYLYFGVVPAVVLFWPFRVLTGLSLPFPLATILFLIGAFLASSWLWLRLVKERYPRAGLLTKLGGIVALGLCGGQLSLARRPSIWEMPISGGYFFVTVMILAAYLSLTGVRPRRWLALCGLALGLAVGCRPTLAFCGGGLVVLVLCVGLKAGGSAAARIKAVLGAALSAGVPLLLIMGALFQYNYARFGSPFEFGIKYQLNTNYEAATRHFRTAFVPFNFQAYFLSLPRIGRYFPFFHQPDLGLSPKGYYGTEFVYGALFVCPVILGILFAGFPLVRRAHVAIQGFTGYLYAMVVPMTCLLLCFDTAAARYTVDFIPLWLWLGMLGWANLEEWASSPATAGRARIVAQRTVFGACFAVSLLVALALSLALHGILVYNNPATYNRIARVFNLPVAAFERLSGERYGKIEMNVQFPDRPSGSLEPLVVTGVGYETDYFFAFYRSDKMVQIGFENSGDSMLLSQQIHYDPKRVYHLGFLSGSVLPPEGHPIYADWNENEVHALLNWVRIDLDGKPIINQERQSHEGAPELLQIGQDIRSWNFGRHFTGTITNVHRAELKKEHRSPETHGDVDLDVTLPSEVVDGAQPLVIAGRPGQAELIGYRTVDSSHFVIAYEYWGAGEWESAPVEIPADRSAHFRIRLGSILMPNSDDPYYDRLKSHVIVWMNGKAILWRDSVGPLEPSPKIEILANVIGSSGMRRSFQGVLWNEKREPAPTWRKGPFKSLDLYLGGRGTGIQPVFATGETGRANTLAIVWLPNDRAQFVYDHWGTSLYTSKDFAWNSSDLHHVQIEAPSFRSLDKAVQGDGVGQLLIKLDGQTVVDAPVRYYDAMSPSFSFGKNLAGSSVASDSLDLYLGDIQQSY